jgi:hypothetical protein
MAKHNDPRVCKGVTICKPPLAENGKRAKSWKECFVTLTNGEVIDGYIGDGWGKYLYFELGMHWRRISLSKLVDNNAPGSAIIRYDLRKTVE